jgi:tocopherol O-methyltransferase
MELCGKKRGEHIHHGYWPTDDSKATETKEKAQLNLIHLLLDISKLPPGSRVLDVGCGIGGTSRYLASSHGCVVTGITISDRQVEIANRLTKTEAEKQLPDGPNTIVNSGSAPVGGQDTDGFVALGKGKVKFIQLDAEKMGDFFADEGSSFSFDAVWISEALSHFPNKPLFFTNVHKALRPGGKLALADWFKDVDVDEKRFVNDIKPIEGRLLSSPPTPL